ncbi:hypothetical protein [Methylomonas sp. MgM2]
MKTSNYLRDVKTTGSKMNLSAWTAGPIVNIQHRKGFNRAGEEMKTLDIKSYVLEVFPPAELAELMQQPSPDVVSHLAHEGVDTRHLNKRHVSFLAYVGLPCFPDESAVEVTLVSEQRQNGGIYKQEINIPRHMLRIRESPSDTVLDSLNNALQNYNWYPPY